MKTPRTYQLSIRRKIWTFLEIFVMFESIMTFLSNPNFSYSTTFVYFS